MIHRVADNETEQCKWSRSRASLCSVHAYKAEVEVHEQTLSGSRTCVYEDSISLMALLFGLLSHYSD